MDQKRVVVCVRCVSCVAHTRAVASAQCRTAHRIGEVTSATSHRAGRCGSSMEPRLCQNCRLDYDSTAHRIG
eukprot:1892593-Rhodomonas_salina.4